MQAQSLEPGEHLMHGGGCRQLNHTLSPASQRQLGPQLLSSSVLIPPGWGSQGPDHGSTAELQPHVWVLLGPTKLLVKSRFFIGILTSLLNLTSLEPPN